MVKKLYVVLIIFTGCMPIYSYAQNCGFKPYALAGCKIGRCVNGKWEQICGESASESNSDLDSINTIIANPKTADIAGALEARRRSVEAKEVIKQPDIIPQQTAPIESNLLVYEELRKTDRKSAITIMASLALGFTTANDMLAYKSMPLLYCKPSRLKLSVENYMQIYEEKLEKNRVEIEKIKDANPALVLLFGLMETFPCQPTK